MSTAIHTTSGKNPERDALVRGWTQAHKKSSPVSQYIFSATVKDGQSIWLTLRATKSEKDLNTQEEIDRSLNHRNIETVEAALALYRVESLIQQLEDWLGVALDFSPTHVQRSPASDALSANFSILDSNNNALEAMQGTVALPLSLLQAALVPPFELAQQLKFVNLDCVLELSCIELKDEQLQELAVGDAVILTSSFEPVWEVLLKPKNMAKAFRPALINVHADSLEIITSDAAISQNEFTNNIDTNGTINRCALVLSNNLSVSVESILGWRVEKRLIPLSAESGLRAILRNQSQCLAEGEVIPAGDGYALWINQLGASSKSNASMSEPSAQSNVEDHASADEASDTELADSIAVPQ